MSTAESIILGIVQGITEFFPISSSAHLIAVRYLFGFSSSELGNLTFDIALHFGTLIAIVVFFFMDFINMFKEGFRFKKNGVYSFKNLSCNGRLLWYIIFACIPAGLAGIFFDDIIEAYIRESPYAPLIISLTLSIMGMVMYFSDKLCDTSTDIEHMSLKRSIVIGVGQMLAIIPGFSRSGTTISVARMAKLDRKSAAKFSFLLGAPVMFGAAILKFKDLSFSAIDVPFILGVVTSFLVGILCIRLLMEIIKKRGFKCFAIYRIILALVLLITYIIR